MVKVTDEARQALDPTLANLLEEVPVSPGKDFVFCARCSHVIGHARDATTVYGRHHHFCTNPHGIDFNVCCYRQALGCTISGQPTGADSWFPGFSWRYATCSGCATHLGWLFESQSPTGAPNGRSTEENAAQFYGLVAERIQIEDGRPT